MYRLRQSCRGGSYSLQPFRTCSLGLPGHGIRTQFQSHAKQAGFKLKPTGHETRKILIVNRTKVHAELQIPVREVT